MVLIGVKTPNARAIGLNGSKVNPDVLALQELCGYDEKQLKADAAKWGHNYVKILKTRGYPVGLTSLENQLLQKNLLLINYGMVCYIVKPLELTSLWFIYLQLIVTSDLKKQIL